MLLTASPPIDPSQGVQIDAPSGPVHGTMTATTRVFKAIPYAQPPIGPLRFRPPRPVLLASNAYAFAPAPMQARPARPDRASSMLGDAPMSEDCLYLNIWSPVGAKSCPVFVWLHGGSNVSGATSQPIYDGATFARDGVLCVTVGYRLGVFGFLECGEIVGEDHAGSGNNAIRDQILALQWVRDNIAAFGGDPTRVTLGGESAGAKNVAALIASPLAKGLFQSAILQSGGGETVHTLSEAQEVARSFVAAFAQRYPGLPADSWRDATAEQLLAVQADVNAAHPRAFAFRSVVNGDVLPCSPLQAVQQGAAKSLRLLMGWNRDESVLFASPMMLARLGRRPEADFPITASELVHKHLDKVQSAMRLEAERNPLGTPFQRRVQILTAEAYSLPTLALAEAQARAGGVVYLYRFDQVQISGPYAGFAPHSSELPLMWNQYADPFFKALFPTMKPPSVDMHAAWVAFMQGNTPDTSETLTLTSGERRAESPVDNSADDLAADMAADLAANLADESAESGHASIGTNRQTSIEWPPYVLDGAGARRVLSIGQQSALVNDPGAALRAVWDV